MAITKKLGASYEQVKDQVKIRTIQVKVGDVSFPLRVRVPIKREMEKIVETISKPDQAHVDEIFERLAAPVKKAVQEGGENFLETLNSNKETILVTDSDVIIDGTSVRQVALFSAMYEAKVEAYFHLLQSETGEPIDETYEQIAEEFPEQVIRQILEDIEAAVRPDYKTAKKN